MNCLILGKSKVGKSTLINNLVSKKVAEEAGVLQDELMRTTIGMESYQIIYKDRPIVLYDTPGIFDQLLNTTLSSTKHIENIIKNVSNIDKVLYCIEASVFGPSDIDLEGLKILNQYPFLKEKIIIVFTKTNRIPKEQFDTFLKKTNISKKVLFAYSKDELIIDDNIFIQMESNDDWCFKILDELDGKIDNTDYSVIMEEQICIPIIKEVQDTMKRGNYYPEEYRKYSSEFFKKLKRSWIITYAIISSLLLVFSYFCFFIFMKYEDLIDTKDTFIVFIGSGFFAFFLLNLILSFCIYSYRGLKTIDMKKLNYRWENEKLVFLQLNTVETDVSIIRGTIKYVNGVEFFRGTFYGNSFNTGVFKYSDGSLMYEKK